MVKTKLKYLEDTYLFEYESKVLEVGENEFGKYVILDETIFYPQGGGQPSDTGIIFSNESVFKVSKTVLMDNGVVIHFGKFETGEGFEIGEKVELKINKEKRILFAKLHSAGHLIDNALFEIGLSDKLKAVKGFHFEAGPYCEYSGSLESPSQYIEELEKKVNELISKKLKIQKENINSEEAEKRNLKSPEGKDVRMVKFEGYEFGGCGGTHVRDSSEIGKIKIRKIKNKKGNIAISYSVE